MGIDEGRLNYRGVNTDFLVDRMQKSLKHTVDYLVEKYEGEEFLTQFFLCFCKQFPDEGNNTKKKYLDWLDKGVDKQVIAAKIIQDGNLKLNHGIKQNSLLFLKRVLANYEWDYSELLNLEKEPFVIACYKEILEREPDESGFVDYCEQIYSGMPKEAVLYRIGSSVEARSIKKVKYLDQYKEIYEQYLARNRGKIEKLKQLIRIPGKIKYMSELMCHNRLKEDYRYTILSRNINQIQEQNQILLEKIGSLEIQIFELKKREREWKSL